MNENQNICAVILAGGHGTRLWQLSRAKRPKQFLPSYSEDETMIQSTLNRISRLNVKSYITLCN